MNEITSINDISAKNLGLVVHDMLNGRLKEGGSHPDAGSAEIKEIVQNNVRVLAACRDKGIPVFFTGHAVREDYLDAPYQLPFNSDPGQGEFHLAARNHRVSPAGDWGAQVIDELRPEESEWIIRKGGGYSAFYNTALLKWLNRLGVRILVIIGAGTNSGIESTVRDARERDIGCIVIEDACHGGGGREYHDASILVMKRFAHITTTDRLEALLSALP